MYHRTARLDLDNLNNDTQDGCHITSMAGSYLAISRGFAGMRTVDALSFRPVLPPEWTGYGFKLRYRGRVIGIGVARNGVRLNLISGEPGGAETLRREDPAGRRGRPRTGEGTMSAIKGFIFDLDGVLVGHRALSLPGLEAAGAGGIRF